MIVWSKASVNIYLLYCVMWFIPTMKFMATPDLIWTQPKALPMLFSTCCATPIYCSQDWIPTWSSVGVDTPLVVTNMITPKKWVMHWVCAVWIPAPAVARGQWKAQWKAPLLATQNSALLTVVILVLLNPALLRLKRPIRLLIN